MKKVLLATTFAAILLAGCNTVRGVGEDISRAGNAVGNAVSGTADKTEDHMQNNY